MWIDRLYVIRCITGTKSNWMMILPVFAVYAVLYYFVFKFVIEKFDLPTPGRDDDEKR